MNLKHSLLGLILIPTLAACTPTVDDKVVIPFSDEVKTINGDYLTLTEYNQLALMVEQEDTFILMIGNATCGCTVEFLPVMRQWIDETDILTYYLEYTELEYQTDKFGIPLVTGRVPILAIFESGVLKHYQAYNPNRSSDNAFLYDLDLLKDWFNDRIQFPSFHFLNKTNMDQLFLETDRDFIIYLGREDCPDCSYAFQTFLVPFLKANPNLPPIYGFDVMVNGIRVPTVTGQESTTGNNTPGWAEFKTDYGMNNVLNTTFGYSTGFVPTFMYIEANGELIKHDPTIIKDMVVTYNDSSRNENNEWTQQLTRTYFDGTRPLQYTDLNLTSLVLEPHTSTAALRDLLKPYHNQAMQDFFDFYLPKVSPIN
jgi:hypothetical protein